MLPSLLELVLRPAVTDYADRVGYAESFLGPEKRVKVKLPALTPSRKKNVTSVTGAKRHGVLDYTNFSVCMNRERRLCFYAVVNIDGNHLRRVARSSSWVIDPRVLEAGQAGPAIYAGNDLDRGHMVRRLDPVWGTVAIATRANRDTFHFTNACPQVHRFNDGVWGQLEDHLLNNAGAEKCRLTVFTGPIFGKKDRVYRGIQLPERFWKVATIVKDGSLVAAGFMLSQAKDLETITGFALGEGRTEQVAIAEIEQLTGLRWPELRAVDTFRGRQGLHRLLARPADMMISPRGKRHQPLSENHAGRT